MSVELVVSSGNKAGQAIPIRVPKFFIGRAEDCHLRPRSDLVSRHHCVVLVEDGYVALRDFGSKNGTYVNGQRVTNERELKSGDKLQIGQLELELRVRVQVGGEKKPKVTSVQEAAARTVESAAAQSHSDDDDADLGDWLGGPEEEAAQEETRTVEVGLVAEDTAENTAAEETVSAVEPDPPANTRTDEPKKGPVRGPKGGGSSGDAAANMLRNFFKGR